MTERKGGRERGREGRRETEREREREVDLFSIKDNINAIARYYQLLGARKSHIFAHSLHHKKNTFFSSQTYTHSINKGREFTYFKIPPKM